MLKILVLIVFSIGLVFAKDIPMVQEIEIDIPIKKFSVIEFPFVVKEKKFSSFVYKKIVKKKKDIKEKIATPKLDIEVPKKFSDLNKKYSSKFKKAVGIKTKSKQFKVSWGKNVAQIFPKHIGHTQLIVWGYESYPMLVTINVVDKDAKSDRYIKFIDYKKEKVASSLKSFNHEKICSKLISYLYKNKTPKGYKLSTSDENYTVEDYQLSLIKSISNKKYTALEYKIINTSDEKLLLNEPMFASSDKNIVYAVSIENRELNSKEATRLFIVVPTVR